MIQKRLIPSAAALAAITLAISPNVQADTALWDLGSAPFYQDWTNTSLITTANDWSLVPSIIGYRGDGAVSSTAVDPQTVTASLSGTPVNVIANQAAATSTTGGIGEFELTDPVVAFQGSGTARAPHLLLSLNASSVSDIAVSYLVRDIDGTGDNSIQPLAFQYRVGGAGDFINLPSAFISDASTGPNAATATFPISLTLPSDANGAAILELRWITTDAAGSDEWIGIDNISVSAVPEPGTAMILVAAGGILAVRRRRAQVPL